jgi:hypothetical protein
MRLGTTSARTVALGGVGPDGAASLYTATATVTNANGMTVQDSVTISSGATTTSSGYARKGTNDWLLVKPLMGSATVSASGLTCNGGSRLFNSHLAQVFQKSQLQSLSKALVYIAGLLQLPH